MKNFSGMMVAASIMLAIVLSVSFASADVAQDSKSGITFRDCPDCPEMVMIPAGSFMMGSNNGLYDNREKPVHRVTFAKPFAMGKTEVTQGQWKAVMGTNPSFHNCGDNCPVDSVNWNDAEKFIRKLNSKTGKQYRLPSEAEWEYACRAGGQQEYCGSDNVDSVAWVGPFSDTTHPVATKQANAFGLYDMSGNVSEWTQDCWNVSYNRAPTNGSAWKSGDCRWRVVRGGAWWSSPREVRAAYREYIVPNIEGFNNRYGFRVARTLP